MVNLLSPGVQIREFDQISVVPSVSTSVGAFAGRFDWGPVNLPTLVTSENQLVRLFGRPTDSNYNSFFTAANFLAYASAMYVCRAGGRGMENAVSGNTASGDVEIIEVDNTGFGYTSPPTVTLMGTSTDAATAYAELLGDEVIRIVVQNRGHGYTTAPSVTLDPSPLDPTTVPDWASGTNYMVGDIVENGGAAYKCIQDNTGATDNAPGTGTDQAMYWKTADATATASIDIDAGVLIENSEQFSMLTENASNALARYGEFAAKYPGSMGNSLKVSLANSTGFNTWTYRNNFDGAPGTNEIHIVVIDEDGLLSNGNAGTILETYAFVSTTSGTKNDDGTNNFFQDIVNSRSEYVYSLKSDLSMSLTNGVFDSSLAGGEDIDTSMYEHDLTTAWNVFENDTLYDIDLLPVGKVEKDIASSVVALAERRKDCVVFISPYDTIGNPIIGNSQAQITAITDYASNSGFTSSYAVMDTGVKYQYDRYNDVFRWVPLNGDIAGLCARTDAINDPWFSPAGITRGGIRNILKLGVNPSSAQRDELYKNNVNPLIADRGNGIILWGDKTKAGRNSSFSRINVRRMFLAVEKAIGRAARDQLFEQNDHITRTNFRSLVESFLRRVQGRRGLINFQVVCDESNNTFAVVENNELVCDIFIQPTRSINFITLTFTASRDGLSFSEVSASI